MTVPINISHLGHHLEFMIYLSSDTHKYILLQNKLSNFPRAATSIW